MRTPLSTAVAAVGCMVVAPAGCSRAASRTARCGSPPTARRRRTGSSRWREGRGGGERPDCLGKAQHEVYEEESVRTKDDYQDLLEELGDGVRASEQTFVGEHQTELDATVADRKQEDK